MHAKYRQTIWSVVRTTTGVVNTGRTTVKFKYCSWRDAPQPVAANGRAPGQPYTKDEDSIIEELRTQHKTFPEIQRALPHRSVQSVHRRWSERLRASTTVGDYSHRLRKFTPDEDNTIKKLRTKLKPWSEIQLALPHRSIRVMIYRWNRHLRPQSHRNGPKVRLHNGRYVETFTAKQDEQLRSLKDRGTKWREIAEIFAKPERSVQARWYYLKLGSQQFRVRGSYPRKPPWDEAEDKLLLQLREDEEKPWPEVMQCFPQRSHIHVQARYRLLKDIQPKHKNFYTVAEDEVLVQGKAKDLTWPQIMKLVPTRSAESLCQRYHYLLARGKVPGVQRRLAGAEATQGVHESE